MFISFLLLIALLIDHPRVINALDSPTGFVTCGALLIELMIEAILAYELATLTLGGAVP